ncbi:MAG: ABC-F family ATP-binding cassette domain-containing protein, partial [Planctomycetes bacterium]|nr:ABC-F family ATP-binding cassette domain-containing protein [Planctomycetota bacterium]
RLERRIRDGEFVLELESKSRNVRFDFSESGGLSGEVLRTVDLSKTYDDKPLFGGLGFQIEAGQRLGITGPNGTGKTTLLRILEGVVESDTGEFEWSPRVSVGYFSQDAKELTGTRTLLDELRSFCPEMDEAEARSHLGRFHFTGADVFKPVGVLSGGEQSRLRLIKLLKTAPNVLVLDEPTNHLDIPSREALEGALTDFPGTIIAVSHDRFFLDRLATRLLVIRPDRHRMIRGNYSDYAAIVEKEGTGANRSVASGAADSNRSEPGKKANASTKSKSSTTKYDSMSVNQIEVMVMDCERRLAAANERFAAPDVYRDPQKLSALQDTISSVRDELSELETVWSERAEQC